MPSGAIDFMLIDRFLQYISFELRLSPLTAKSYEGDLQQFVSFLTGGHPEQFDAPSVTLSDVRAWMLHLSTGPHAASARTVRRKLQAVRAFYRWLMRQGLATVNPAADVELARLPKRLPTTVRQGTVDAAIADAAQEQGSDFEQVRDSLMLLMLYDTGMRRAELIGLQDAWVDTAQQQLRVRGKRNKDRIIPFGPELAQAIGHYRQVRDTQVGREPGCDAFFVTAKGRPLYPALVYRTVHQHLQQAGGTGKLSPHVLRHTFASAMLNDGAEIEGVRQLLGHTSLAATQVYTHITLSDLKHNYELAHPRALIKKGG